MTWALRYGPPGSQGSRPYFADGRSSVTRGFAIPPAPAHAAPRHFARGQRHPGHPPDPIGPRRQRGSLTPPDGRDHHHRLGTGPWTGSSGEKGRWLFCQGDTGGGVGAVAARSTGDGQWTTQSLGLAQTNHAGDVINVDFGSYSAVSLTRDSLVSGGHQHVWTNDSGKTWYSIGPLGG